MRKIKTLHVPYLVLSWIFLGLAVFVLTDRQNIVDWWRIINFQVPPAIAILPKEDNMTAYARHLFYASRPQFDNKKSFVNDCKVAEQTIVLGCYTGNQKIYLLYVTDKRLSGVEQVTAAHEMLHAAYDRMPADQKKKINVMVEQAYAHISSSRIRQTMLLYRKTEPHQFDNELHSILGTEVAKLPRALEDYYRRYFVDRSKIVKYSQHYEQAFTAGKQQAASLLDQINQQKAQIGTLQTKLETLYKTLEVGRMHAITYNQIQSYNSKIAAYNTQLTQLKHMIASCNILVDRYNKLVVEQQQLIQEVSANPAKPRSV